jgi:hypothetical protein
VARTSFASSNRAVITVCMHATRTLSIESTLSIKTLSLWISSIDVFVFSLLDEDCLLHSVSLPLPCPFRRSACRYCGYHVSVCGASFLCDSWVAAVYAILPVQFANPLSHLPQPIVTPTNHPPSITHGNHTGITGGQSTLTF